MNLPVLPETLWKVKDVAVYLGCSASYVYKAAEKGEIPTVRMGAMLRFQPEAIRQFVQQNSVLCTAGNLKC